jgi:hypothetical protein
MFGGPKQNIKKRIKNITPDWYLQIRWWCKAHGVFPRIGRPITFNEKILSRNLFDRRAVFTQFADKAAVRSYVKRCLGPEILPQVYHLTTDPRTIPFETLPDRFVVKPTHGSGWVQLVPDKSKVDRAALVTTCANWLRRSYYKETREIVYKHIKPRILIQEFIDDGSGTTPNDYKLFVFDGVVQLIQIDIDRFNNHQQWFYTPMWKKLDVIYVCGNNGGEVKQPAHLAEMIKAAETLGRDWDFIRVDFYDVPHRLYFGELTLTPNGGYAPFCPKEFDYFLGSLWKTGRERSNGLCLRVREHRRGSSGLGSGDLGRDLSD